MCFHDSRLKVSSLTYDFQYSLLEVYDFSSGIRTDQFTSNIDFVLTRVFLSDKALPVALEGLDGLDSFLEPNEFFLLSDCCCPCKWTIVSKLATPYQGVATQTRKLEYPLGHIPPGPLNGTVTFEANVGLGVTPNLATYPDICGQNKVTFAPQSKYWPTFDGVTVSDPVLLANGVNWPVTEYVGDALLNPGVGSIYFGSSPASPYVSDLGYFLWYDPQGGLPPPPIPGVTGQGNGFRNPCDTSMNFLQEVKWIMQGINAGGANVTGAGTGKIAIQFFP